VLNRHRPLSLPQSERPGRDAAWLRHCDPPRDQGAGDDTPRGGRACLLRRDLSKDAEKLTGAGGTCSVLACGRGGSTRFDR
jgi:hypothetical protein